MMKMQLNWLSLKSPRETPNDLRNRRERQKSK